MSSAVSPARRRPRVPRDSLGGRASPRAAIAGDSPEIVRTKGTQVTKGTKGRLTGALRNQGTFDWGALIERSTGEAPLSPFGHLSPLRPTHLQKFHASGVCLGNGSVLWNYVIVEIPNAELSIASGMPSVIPHWLMAVSTIPQFHNCGNSSLKSAI